MSFSCLRPDVILSHRTFCLTVLRNIFQDMLRQNENYLKIKIIYLKQQRIDHNNINLSLKKINYLL